MTKIGSENGSLVASTIAVLIATSIIDSHFILIVIRVAVLVLNIDLVSDFALLVHLVTIAVLVFFKTKT